MNTRLISGSAVVATMTLMLAFASTASADPTIQGGVKVGANYASSNGKWVEVCDMEQDGNGVYGIFKTSTGTARVSDGNGSAGGCGNATFAKVIEFKVCEDDFGSDTCSSWAKP